MIEDTELVKFAELKKQGVLDDPDFEDSEGDQYPWTEEFQRRILGLLINDATFIKTSLGLVKPAYFTDEVHQEVCRIILKHFTEYGVKPDRVYILQAIEDKIGNKNEAVKLRYFGEFHTICEYFTPGVS